MSKLDFIQRFSNNKLPENVIDPIINEYRYDKNYKTNDFAFQSKYAQYLRSKFATDHELTNAINCEFEDLACAAASNPNLKSHHLDDAIKSKNGIVRSWAASNPSATEKHFDQLIHDKSIGVRIEVADNNSIKQKHIDHLLNDASPFVRNILASRLDLSRDHVLTLANDSTKNVRTAILKNPKYQEYFPNGHENT